MKPSLRTALGACAWFLGACAGPSVERHPSPAVVLEPDAPLDAAPSVLRVHVAGLAAPPNALALFVGALDDYYAEKVVSGTTPTALGDRRVPSVAWQAANGDAVLAPSAPLLPGQEYGLVALGLGNLATLTVSGDTSAYAERVWPPRAASTGGVRSVFCGSLGAPMTPARIVFDPANAGATVAPGVGDGGELADQCLHAELEDPGPSGTLVPPPLLEEIALDPGPISLDSTFPPVDSVTCSEGERQFGPGCAVIEDDRLVVRSASEPLLWTILLGAGQIAPVLGDGRFVVSGLTPSTVKTLSGSTTDLLGREARFDEVVETLAPEAHVVINEVLSNPIGPEPAQEWVELTNDGLIPADLDGFTLSDGAASTPLPPAQIAPGQFALVVAAAFDPLAGRDVPPVPGTLIVRVPRIGRDGLSNSGETLTLRSADGTVVSVFPALADSVAGVSIARKTPASLDDDALSFGPHASPGASPGAANHIDSP